jgi:predicted acylesterase/phospholipase RssA
MGDSRIGHAVWGDYPLSLGEAVACSAAFPPVFTPGRIKRANYHFGEPIYGERPLEQYPLIPLSDGGVYDNSALEAVWKATKLPGIEDRLQVSDFLIVSDAGAPPHYHFRSSGIPGWTDALLLYRADQIAREQVSALRRRELVSGFADQAQSRKGLLVYIGSGLQNIPAGGGDTYARSVGQDVCIPPELVESIRKVRTNLDVFSEVECFALMYHAYTMTDAFLWAHRNTCPPQYRVPDQPNPIWKMKFTGELIDLWASGLAESNRIRIF